MGLGIFTNPIAIVYLIIVLLKELGLISTDLTRATIFMIGLFIGLFYMSMRD